MQTWCAILLVYVLLLQHCLPLYAADEGEVSIGRKFSLVAQSQLSLIREYTVRRYVERLGQHIVARLDQPEFNYQFSVVQEPHINAFSVPGGYIYVHSGLIQKADSDDELASVLGHEIAHVQGHHMVRQQQDTRLLSYAGLAAMALAIINPVLAAGASSAAKATQLKYQRQLEEEADYRGLQYMSQAGFDPQAMPRFFKTMQSEDLLNGVNVPPYLLSHPLSQERLSYIERTLKTLQWNQTAPSSSFQLEQVQAILRTLQEPRSRVIADYEKKVVETSDDPRTLALLGTVFLHYNDWERARQSLEQASAKGVHLNRELGIAYLRLGQRDRARQLLLQQSESDPADADTHRQLCSLFLQEGSLSQAEQECRTAVDLDPCHDEAVLTLAQIFQQQGKKGESRLLIAQAMEAQGRLESARSQYQQAMQALGPTYPQAEELKQKTQELEELIRELPRQRGR